MYHYICHHCVSYVTTCISNIDKHFQRKNKCKSATLYSYENSKLLSKRKYVLNTNIKNISKTDYLYIVTHYLDDINTIDDNYKSNELIPIIEEDKSDEIKKSKIEDGSLILVNQSSNSKIELDNIYFNKTTNMYHCGICNSEYSFIHNLKRHLEKKTCTKRVKKIQLYEDTKNDTMNILNILEKEKTKQAIHNTYINQHNINNNIQNNNNKNSNTNNNTYHLDIKDFVNDYYDLSHIKDDFYEQKDCFLYHNFLSVIMENKKNQNIYFSSGEAIVYTDKGINKMSLDKAGYLMLGKLSDSFDQLLYRQNDETQLFYKFIKDYYRIIKGHYKHDTIFKEYDVDQQKFVYTSYSGSFRSRDKYLTKMVTTLNNYKSSARENMLINLDEINDIPTLNPSIEDFASTKMRYRDLRDKD